MYWQDITLSNLSLLQWRKASILARLIGLFSDWYPGSILLQYSEAIAAGLISLVFILAPFASTSLIGLLLIACAGFWVLLTLSESRPEITSIHLLVLLYWAICVVATAFSPLKKEAFSGLLIFTLYLTLFALCAKVFQNPKMMSRVMTILLLIFLLVSAYGIRQKFIGVAPLATWNDPTSPLAQETRVYSYLGNPNLLGGYLIPAVAFSFAALITWKSIPKKTLAGCMFLVNSACLFYTSSRGAWIGLVVVYACLLLGLRYWWKDYLSPFWKRWLLPIIFGSFGLVILVAIIILEPIRLRVLSIFSGRGDSSNNFRINVWLASLKIIGDNPLIGIGPGHEVFNKIYPRYMQTKFTALSAYSIFLETAVETGLIGLLSFLWLIIVTINQGITQFINFRKQNNPQGVWMLSAIAALAGMLAHGCVDTVWYRPEINTIWWLTVGIIASSYSKVKVIY